MTDHPGRDRGGNGQRLSAERTVRAWLFALFHRKPTDEPYPKPRSEVLDPAAVGLPASVIGTVLMLIPATTLQGGGLLLVSLALGALSFRVGSRSAGRAILTIVIAVVGLALGCILFSTR